MTTPQFMVSLENFWNDQIYTDRRQIIEELHKRRADTSLQKKVLEFWGDNLPSFILDESTCPYGFFSRPLITPNMEMHFFIDIYRDFGVNPIFLEFPDKFSTINKSKYYLAKLHFRDVTKSNKPLFIKKRIVDFNLWEGELLSEVRTISGQSLRDFHHQLFETAFPAFNDKIFDIYDWFRNIRYAYGDYYYLGYLTLGIFHGVIFENFLLDDAREREFFVTKVIPSFNEVERIFGVKPLISPILPVTAAKLDEWYFYPKSYLDSVRNIK